MKFLIICFLFVALSSFAANPPYQAFKGVGGIVVTTNPPNGDVTIDGSGVVASGTNSSLQFSTNGFAVSTMASNLNLMAGNNMVLKGTNIGSTAHINYGMASNLTFNTDLGPVVVGSWGDVWGVSNVSLGELVMWLPEVDSSSELHFKHNLIVGGIVQATNVTLTAIPGTGTNVGITAGGTLFRTTVVGGVGSVLGGQSATVTSNAGDYTVSVGLKDLLISSTNRIAFSNGIAFALSPDGITNNAVYLVNTNGTLPALVWRTATDDTFNGVGIQPNQDFATILDIMTTYGSLGQLRMYGIRLTNDAVVGKVWTATSTDGSGTWSNAPAGGITSINEDTSANHTINMVTNLTTPFPGITNPLGITEFNFPWAGTNVSGVLHSNDFQRFSTPITNFATIHVNTIVLTNALGSNAVRLGVQDLTNSVAVIPNDGEVLGWNAAMKKWTNVVVSTAGVPVGPSGAIQFVEGTALAGTNIFTYNRTNSAVGINTNQPQATLHVIPPNGAVQSDYFRLDDTNGTRRATMGVLPGFSEYGTVWLGTNAPTTANYAFAGNSSALNINGDTISFNAAAGARWQINASGHLIGTATKYVSAFGGLLLKSNTTTAQAASVIGAGGFWLGTTNNQLVAVHSPDASTTITTVLAPAGKIFTQTNTVIVTNTTTTSALLGGVGTTNIAANLLKVGTTVRVNVWGIYFTDGAPGGTTLTMRVLLGGSVAVQTSVEAPPAGNNGQSWRLSFDAVVRTTGASGLIMPGGMMTYGRGAATVSDVQGMPSATTVTLDTTAAIAVSVDASLNNLTDAIAVHCQGGTIEVIP